MDELRHALESIRPVETMAQSASDETLRTIAQTARGWIALAAGQMKLAGDMAREVYNQSRSLEQSPGRAFSRAFVGDLAREMGRYEQAVEMTTIARDMFARFGETMWAALMWAQLGQIAVEQGQFETAVTHYEQCLQLSRNAGDRFGTIIAFRCLGQILSQQEFYARAEHYYQRSLFLVEKSQNPVYLDYLANDFGQLYLAQVLNAPNSVQEIARQEEHMHQAARWFERAERLARKVDLALMRVHALVGQAQLEMEDHALDEAQEKAREAVTLAERTLQQRPIKTVKQTTAVAWRVLGQVLAKVPQKNKQVSIAGKTIDAIACFGRSRQLLDEVGVAGNLEKAMTLRAWALLELRRDHVAEATPLATAARELLVKLGRQQDATQISELMESEK
jgi:tetratricopeptide (TPR) repeat protein